MGVVALAQNELVEFDALIEIRIGLRPHIGGDAAEARPDGDEIVPAGREQMQLVGHLDLPRQRGREPDQRARYRRHCAWRPR